MLKSLLSIFTRTQTDARAERGGGTPYNGLYGKAPPERGTFFRVEVRSELRAGAN